MFQVTVSSNSTPAPFKLEIEGCPSSGLAAVDFRRAHGLPETPTNEITLPALIFQDESFCRAMADFCGGTADFNLHSIMIRPWTVAKEEVVRVNCDYDSRKMGGYGKMLCARPDAIREYLAAQTPETAKELVADIVGFAGRSKDAAVAKVAKMHADKLARETAIASAREILAPELAEAKKNLARIAYLEGELQEAREKIEELEPEEVDQD